MEMVQLRRRHASDEVIESTPDSTHQSETHVIDPIAIPLEDPLRTVLLSSDGPVEVATLELQSEVVDQLRKAGVELIVPLIGQGELLGALYLGHRLSDQPYSTDDRRLLDSLASRVAPAMKVALLVQEQKAEAKERERIEQELQVAALIQQTLLPKELPTIPGWGIDAFYRPAREVGGDFYDFIDLGRGRLGVIIGDVTDKGVPAALVMATCRSMLRSAAPHHLSPAEVLAEVNDTIVEEIPPAMFITCLYAIIDTAAGEVVFANAGHNLPYVRTADGVIELRATGMPLGLMREMEYDNKVYRMKTNEVMVLTSDGITEAHNSAGEMYGFGRLMGRVAKTAADSDMVKEIVGDLEGWTGADAEQEDDITLVVVRRTSSAEDSAAVFSNNAGEKVLASFTVSSEEGNEVLAIKKVTAAVGSLGLEPLKLERLKTAVGETVMNAIEHGNEFRADLDVAVEVKATDAAVRVRVSDYGDDKVIPDAETPDIEAKLAGKQNPRGWGLFLIEKMVDDVWTESENGMHIVELVMNREGDE
jgi:serine phosphatase RsbU (regulator of sigma subunit)/anti-sigma regulatory factor (Ser/Thr protein kinase)